MEVSTCRMNILTDEEITANPARYGACRVAEDDAASDCDELNVTTYGGNY